MALNQMEQHKGNEDQLPKVGTGNASNPSPESGELNPADSNQLLDEKAEKYLREVSSPEDYPDAVDEKEIDEQTNRQGGKDRQNS